MYYLSTPLTDVQGIGAVTAKKLASIDIHTVSDFLLILPLRYDDRSQHTAIDSLPLGEVATITGYITDAKQFRKGKRTFQSATAHDETGSIKLQWFNNPYIISQVQPEVLYTISGKVGKYQTLVQPTIEKVGQEGIHTGRIVPFYTSTTRMPQGTTRRLAHHILKQLAVETQPLDEYLHTQHSTLPDLLTALKILHFPDQENDVSEAKKRIALEEFVQIARQGRVGKEEWSDKASVGQIHTQPQPIVPASIPFAPTNAQERSIQEIMHDLGRTTPMNRLLIGDVGSGKTVVAGTAAYHLVRAGHSVALIAPTKLLATQHTETLRSLFPDMEVAVLTSTRALKEASTPRLVVGTHSVINQLETISPALVIYDEQHRFGVLHRSTVMDKKTIPHTLTMTATPIPRSMMLTLFSHLSVSHVDELPRGRKPTTTWVVPEQKRADSYQWIKNQLKTNPDWQVLIVCPFVNPSEAEHTAHVANAVETHKHIQSAFPGYTVGLLHGQQTKKEQKTSITAMFQKDTQILVTTPIVEVGVDLPQASIIIIESAERFGLASLHQLRGRVGRAGSESYCLLFVSKKSGEATKRLRYITTHHNGSELAQKDLEMRGAGSLFGTEQSGFAGLRFASWSNIELLKLAQHADEVLPKQWSSEIISIAPSADTQVVAN
ncbi:MAG: ATP-dependent DNA helicase RecG [Pseudomonadales bacterium]|nr:ATP-dependent DNA helicase RecG [Candidatus Woesebacteria bacterium]MCB9802294.1 ATP-dependent DNA helicase RecG [Pseudomonadales bacterium]